MSDPIDRSGLKGRFWERKPLKKMSQQEWEALCDGCGKCCLNKLEDEDTGEVALTRIACRLLDDATCRCAHYENRHEFVPDCIVLRPDNLDTHAYWMPDSCAYRLLWKGTPRPDLQPLITRAAPSVHDAGISVRGITLSEFDIPEEDWEAHIIEDPS